MSDGDEVATNDMNELDARGAAAPVRQLRVVVAAEDFEAALAFYRDALGLPQLAAFEGDGDARVAILDAGRATLELANPAQVAMIDSVEVGRAVSPHIRIAFEVTDAENMTRHLSAAGAQLIAAPKQTPWGSLNARLAGPAGLQLTLFEELSG
jgi:predicted enzyme related to lactoylglutathione lyase